ncbi:MAG: ABC transporter permease [Actinobacteria bacterium]|nr:ABC transporter permease [Actinomycetota bacterium]
MGWLTGAVAWLADGAHWQGADGVPQRLLEHVGLSAAAVGIGCLLALPLGLWLGHVRRGGAFAVATGNLARAVPTFAVLVLLALAPSPFGLGTTSTLTALVLFAVPPLLTNAYVGVLEVDPAAVDAARGMGLTSSQVLRRVELPLAVPLVMNGVRLAAVQVVATATIAALVAGGGLGRIIVEGFGRQDQPQLLAGAFLVLALALAVEGGMELLQRRVDPLRRARGRRRTAAGAQLQVQGGSS